MDIVLLELGFTAGCSVSEVRLVRTLYTVICSVQSGVTVSVCLSLPLTVSEVNGYNNTQEEVNSFHYTGVPQTAPHGQVINP